MSLLEKHFQKILPETTIPDKHPYLEYDRKGIIDNIVVAKEMATTSII